MRTSLPSSTPADAAAPTILTSRPEGKHSERAKDGATYKGPHGCCRKCKYEVFVRGEDCPYPRPDGPSFEGRRRTAVSAEANPSPSDDPARKGKRRTAISAEAFGIFGQEHQERPQAVPKCKEVRRFLWNALIGAGTPLQEWARDLEEDFFEQVISAARAWKAKAGDEIILQGEPLADTAPGIYILESGELDVYKAYAGDALPGQLVKTYARKGEYFGELGVLYGAPRAATVIAAGACHLWSIDRNAMTTLKRQCMEARRLRYSCFLSSVQLLRPLGLEDRMQVIDNLRPVRFKEGEAIIQQGDEGHEFFLLEQGNAVAEKDGEEVARYGPGSCFGELALLNNKPRAASVIAASACKCAALDRASFDRLLGPLAAIRAREEEHPVQTPNAELRQSRRSTSGRARESVHGEPQEEHPAQTPDAKQRQSRRSGSCRTPESVYGEPLEEHPMQTPRAEPRQSRRSSSGYAPESVHGEPQEDHPVETPNAEPRQSRRSSSGRIPESVHGEDQEEHPVQTPNAEPRQSRRSCSGRAPESNHGEALEEHPVQTPNAEPRQSRRSSSSRARESVRGEPQEEHLVQTASAEPRQLRRSSARTFESVHGEPQEEHLVQTASAEPRQLRRSSARTFESVHGEPQEEQMLEFASRSTQSHSSRYPIVSMSIENDEDTEILEEPCQALGPGSRGRQRSSCLVTDPVETNTDHDPAHRKSLQMTPDTRGRTPPPPDYAMSREDRLMYDSEEDDLPLEGGGSEFSASPARACSRPRLSEAASVPTTPEQHEPPPTPTRSRLSAGAAAMKNLLRMGRKSSSREEAAAALRDAAAPCAL